MHVKQAGLATLILALLWFSGCTTTEPAGTKEATSKIEIAISTDVTNEKVTNSLTDSAEKTRTIDSSDRVTTNVSEAKEVLTLARLLERLDRIASLDPVSIKQQIQQMDARFGDLNPADRYEFSLLITLKDATNKSLNRAITILDELKENVKDPIVQKILLLHRRNYVLEKQYSSERGKKIELKKKIERLKGLEQDLDNSNTRMQEHLNSSPGDAQQP
jgi:hypothetical protein